MVDMLVADGHVYHDLVVAALRRVPREIFMPDGVDLVTAYDAQQAPITKRDEAGGPMSSVSAPWLQARMIEQAGIRPGMRVLESSKTVSLMLTWRGCWAG